MVISEFAQSLRPFMAKFGIDAPDIRIHSMTLDSRAVSKYTAFVAVKGHTLDGRDYIEKAIELGSPVILAQADTQQYHAKVETRITACIIYVHQLPDLLSSLAGAFYDYPANKLHTTAVTGTNGKTSTVSLITQSKQLLGTRSAAIGTLGSAVYDAHEVSWTQSENRNTTPDAITMQYLLAEFAQQDVGHVAFEASSHALVQKRLSKINTDVVIFTNQSRDHLDYHSTMEEYAAAKRLLLEQPGIQAAVVNIDDQWAGEWLKDIQKKSIRTVVTAIQTDIATISPQLRHCVASSIQYHSDGCHFLLTSSWGEARVSTALLGEFNVRNLLSTIACLLIQGERFDEVVKIVPKLTAVAGRMEMFRFNKHANIVIDYAHTPDALEKALNALTEHNKAKPWCVFGCGGDRDKGKRPQMGMIAERLSERVVITTDNARSEEPLNIENDIKVGLSHPEQAVCLADRKDAITYCLKNAPEDTLILLAGKGHETYQTIQDKQVNYDERAYVMQLQEEFTL